MNRTAQASYMRRTSITLSTFACVIASAPACAADADVQRLQQQRSQQQMEFQLKMQQQQERALRPAPSPSAEARRRQLEQEQQQRQQQLNNERARAAVGRDSAAGEPMRGELEQERAAQAAAEQMKRYESERTGAAVREVR